jgi:membrane associated rhomboid family serine protease
LLSVHIDADNPQADTLHRPWMWWQFLTYGFVHDPLHMEHIVFNMLALFFLGRDVEAWYGTREFIRLYLVMLVFSALIYTFANRLFEPGHRSVLFGASGAIAGVIILFALNFPKRILLFMFVIPMPAWLVGVMAIAYDVYGSMGRLDPHIAYTAHLGGAAFALAYFNLHWNFGRLSQSASTWLKRRSRPALKVFKPTDDADGAVAEEDVDRILEKIHREGENSLTRKERRILENASREYQRRRRPD